MNLRKFQSLIAITTILVFPVIGQRSLAQGQQSNTASVNSAPTNEVLPKGVPDVQVMVGPGARGYTVAFVFPKKVDTKVVKSLVQDFVKLSNAPMTGLTIETSRLEHEAGAKIEKEPLMTSATFETKAELIDRQAGGFLPENFIIALQTYDRIQVTFLVDQAFVYSKARHLASENVNVDVYGQQGAFTFVANIRKRPLAEFVMPDKDAVVGRTKPQRKASNGFLLLIFGLAIAGGLATMFIVKRNVGR